MNITLLIALAALLLVSIVHAAPDTPSPLAPGATLEKLADGFSFTEGPVFAVHPENEAQHA